MKKIFTGAISLALLSGCAPYAYHGGISQNEQMRIMQELETSRNSAKNDFPSYANVCLAVFPDARSMKNDGGKHLSEQWSVNIELVTDARRIVCSVSRDTMQVERIHTGARIFTLSEYKELLATNSLPAAIDASIQAQEPDPPTNDPRLSYKNTRLGDSKGRFETKLPLYDCRGASCSFSQSSCESSYSSAPKASARECMEGTSYGGAKPKYGFAHFIDGKLSKISLTITTDQMAVLDATLTEKYGKPAKVDTTPFMNKMGNTLPNSEKTWLVEGEKLVLTYRSSVVDEGYVEISGKAAEAQSKEQTEKRLKANTKDF